MRQNPHVRICGGPGSATTLVYPTLPSHRRLHRGEQHRQGEGGAKRRGAGFEELANRTCAVPSTAGPCDSQERHEQREAECLR